MKRFILKPVETSLHPKSLLFDMTFWDNINTNYNDSHTSSEINPDSGSIVR